SCPCSYSSSYSYSCSRPFAHPSLCHSERSGAESRKLSMLLTSVKLSAHNETSTAARNRHVRQNSLRKISAAAASSISGHVGDIAASKRAQSKRRSERRV